MIWAGVLALGVISGCRPPYPECRQDRGDADCADHFELCVDGKCRECRSDSDCDEDQGKVCIMNACMKPDMRPERMPFPGRH